VYLNKFSKRSLILEYVIELTGYLDSVHKHHRYTSFNEQYLLTSRLKKWIRRRDP
jgi:hypothetical protein